jgi:hypothetical protein
VVLEAEVGDVIAEGVEKVVIAVVRAAEEPGGFFDQILVVIPNFRRGFESGGAVGGDIHFGDVDLLARGTTLRNSPVMTGESTSVVSGNGLEVRFGFHALLDRSGSDRKRRCRTSSLRGVSGWRCS